MSVNHRNKSVVVKYSKKISFMKIFKDIETYLQREKKKKKSSVLHFFDRKTSEIHPQSLKN